MGPSDSLWQAVMVVNELLATEWQCLGALTPGLMTIRVVVSIVGKVLWVCQTQAPIILDVEAILVPWLTSVYKCAMHPEYVCDMCSMRRMCIL